MSPKYIYTYRVYLTVQFFTGDLFERFKSLTEGDRYTDTCSQTGRQSDRYTQKIVRQRDRRTQKRARQKDRKTDIGAQTYPCFGNHTDSH